MLQIEQSVANFCFGTAENQPSNAWVNSKQAPTNLPEPNEQPWKPEKRGEDSSQLRPSER